MGLSFQMLLVMAGVLTMSGMFFLAFSGPSVAKASNRRLESVRERHSRSSEVSAQAQL
jgi:tight adherence protein B